MLEWQRLFLHLHIFIFIAINYIVSLSKCLHVISLSVASFWTHCSQLQHVAIKWRKQIMEQNDHMLAYKRHRKTHRGRTIRSTLWKQFRPEHGWGHSDQTQHDDQDQVYKRRGRGEDSGHLGLSWEPHRSTAALCGDKGVLQVSGNRTTGQKLWFLQSVRSGQWCYLCASTFRKWKTFIILFLYWNVTWLWYHVVWSL